MTPAPREGMPRGAALSRYLAYFGPICNHHRDECPDDCEGQLTWQARADLAALLSEVDAARAKAIEECAKVCDAAGATWGEMYERIDKHTNPENKANAHGHRNQARALATEIRALAAQDRAKETTK